MENKPTLQKLQKLFSGFLITAVGVFILSEFLNHLGQIKTSITSINPFSIVLSFVFFLGYYYLRAISWNLILKSLGEKLSLKEAFFIFFAGESTRYIPGSIWSFASRYYLTRKKNLSRFHIVYSLALEVILLLSVTSVLSLPVLISTGKKFELDSIYIVILALGLGSLGLIFFSNKLKTYLDKLQNALNQAFASSSFYLAVLVQLLAWSSFGIGTYVIVHSFAGVSAILIASIAILSWLIGYASFITPMGLGIREAAAIVFLTPIIGQTNASLVAVLSRVVLIGAEILNLIPWLYSYQRSKVNKFFKSAFEYWDIAILIIFMLGYAITFSTLSILRHNAFASGYDLANMGQTVWNTLHGRFFQLSGAENTISRFSIHADLILALISPLYLIWDRVYTLLITQSVALALGAVPVFLLSKKLLSKLKVNCTAIKLTSLALVLVYLLNPGMEWTNIYDFHGVALAIPFLLATFYFGYSAHSGNTKNWKWFYLFALLSFLTKEEVSLLVSMIGLSLILVFKERVRGLLVFLAGIVWFLVMVFVIIPHYSPGGIHWGLNDLYGPARVKLHNISSPTDAWNVFQGYFLANQSFDYYIALLKPFSFTPILGLPWIILAAPEFAINLLSADPQMTSVDLHYDSGITPFLIIATIFGFFYIIWLLQKTPLRRFLNQLTLALVALLLVIAVRVNYHYSPLPTTPSCWCLMYQVNSDDIEFAKVLQTIPPNASVTSSSEIRAHLTRRENSFTLPGSTYEADYVAIIDQNRILGDYSPKTYENQLLKDPTFLNTHILINHTGHFYLFKKV